MQGNQTYFLLKLRLMGGDPEPLCSFLRLSIQLSHYVRQHNITELQQKQTTMSKTSIYSKSSLTTCLNPLLNST